MQIDNLNELPKDKRPTDEILWEGTPEDLDKWLEEVIGPKKKKSNDTTILTIKDIEE